MKVFAIVLTQEQRFRFRMLQKEHGLLQDRDQKKTYAVVREASPTNWPGRYARAYLVHETAAQTIELDGKSVEINGATVEVKEPLNMVAKVKLGSRRGEDGVEREVHLTAETMFDRTQSVQVRRLGNRRFQWFHALAFACVGSAATLMLVAVIMLFSAHPNAQAQSAPPIVVTPGSAPAAPQSGPVAAPTPDIIVSSHTTPTSPTS